MKDRLKQLRKSLSLTQEEFSKKIGIKRNTLANYEIGRNEPIDAVIFSICREFNVNENWLRNGDGEMYIAESEAVKRTAILLGKRDTKFEQLIEMYDKLNEQNKKLFVELGRTLLENE